MTKAKIKTISYYVISAIILCLFAWYCFVACPKFFENLGRAISALFESVVFYFESIFGTPGETPSISVVPEGIDSQLPLTWNEFTSVLSRWWNVIWTKSNFEAYLAVVAEFLGPLAKVLAIAIPLVAVAILLLKQFSIPKENTKRKQTAPLKSFLSFEKQVLKPCYVYAKELILFGVTKKSVRYVFIATFCIFFNIISIIVELFAFVFYFVVSYDFLALYAIFARTFCNFAPVFKLPFIVWILALFLLIFRYRKKRARRFLNALENFNVKFIKELPIISMSVGTMGSKKTTCITDMALSASNIFREQAKKTMIEKSLLFPNFNWRLFEDELIACCNDGTIWSLRSAKKFIQVLEKEYGTSEDVKLLFDYDVKNYPLKVYDGLRHVTIWKAMEVYAQCFFIYTRQSITVSNYAIKENSRIEFVGNSPIVTSDFHSDEREGEYSHVINFDSLRLGRKFKDSYKDRKERPFFDCGVVVVSEAGKERGNQFDTRGQKKDDENVNQLNDLFNDFIKLIRNMCTVDYFPYAIVFFDDQRPESLGADCRELSYINQIAGSSELKLAMPLFWIEELIHEWIYPKYAEYNEEYNFYSGKTTLRYYLYTKLVSWIHNFYVTTYNRYGYYALTINQQSGKMDGEPVEKFYYLSRKKIYSDVFATDCFSEYLADDVTEAGIDMLPCYADVVPSREEYDEQNSFLVENKLKNYRQQDP
ncbi:MAG: hypothetical protein E7353_06805 [Clostridiales bacterium]|nr:hypothetical protein [Clostridiales bacterium]